MIKISTDNINKSEDYIQMIPPSVPYRKKSGKENATLEIRSYKLKMDQNEAEIPYLVRS